MVLQTFSVLIRFTVKGTVQFGEWKILLTVKWIAQIGSCDWRVGAEIELHVLYFSCFKVLSQKGLPHCRFSQEGVLASRHKCTPVST